MLWAEESVPFWGLGPGPREHFGVGKCALKHKTVNGCDLGTLLPMQNFYNRANLDSCGCAPQVSCSSFSGHAGAA